MTCADVMYICGDLRPIPLSSLSNMRNQEGFGQCLKHPLWQSAHFLVRLPLLPLAGLTNARARALIRAMRCS